MTSGKCDKNRVYFIGAGPGHVKNLTLEGRAAVEECALVYAFDPYPDTFAAILSGKTVADPFERLFDELIREVEDGLSRSSVGFLVPGDMTVFSPFWPVAGRFSGRSRVIAGVGAMNAASALLGQTLDMPGVSHCVIQTSPKYFDKADSAMELERLARTGGTMVLYMNNRPLEKLAEELSGGLEPDTPVAIASRIGMDGERVYRCTLSNMAEAVGEDDIFGLVSGEPSLAVIVIGRILTARPDPDFWDCRKEKLWNRDGSKGGSPETF